MQGKIKAEKCKRHQGLEDSSVNLINLSKESNLPSLACPLCMDQEDNQNKRLYISVNRFSKIQSFYKGINDQDTEKKLHELQEIRKRCNKIFDDMKQKILMKSHSPQLAQKYGVKLLGKDTLENEIKNQISQFNCEYLDLEGLFKRKQKEKEIDEKIRKKYFKENNGIKVINWTLNKTGKVIKKRVAQNQKFDKFIKKAKQNQQLSINNKIPNLDSFKKRIFYEGSIFCKKLFLNTKTLSPQLFQQLIKYQWKELQQLYIDSDGEDTVQTKHCLLQNIQDFNKKLLKLFIKDTYSDIFESCSYHNQVKFLIIRNIKNYSSCINIAAKCTKLKSFMIKQTCINVEEFKQLLAAKPPLKNLGIVNTKIGGLIVKQIQAVSWDFLQVLDLSYNAQVNQNLSKVCGIKWKKLRILKLKGNNLNNRSVQIISKTQWNCLSSLDLQSNEIRVGGAIQLVKKTWKNAICINLKNNCIVLKLWELKKKNVKNKIKVKVKFGKKQKLQNCSDYLVQKAVIFEDKQKKIKQIRFEITNQGSINTNPVKIFKEAKEVFDKVDVLFQNDPIATIKLCENILNTAVTPEQIKESQKIVDSLIQETKKSDDSLSTILVGLKQSFESEEGNFIIAKNSNTMSQLTTKVLMSGFMEDKVKFTEHMEDTEEWNFDQIQKQQEKREAFKKWYITEKAKQFKISESEIIIHRLIQGSIQIQWSTTNTTDNLNIIKANAQKKTLKIHRYFSNFCLSPDDFHTKGNIQFGASPAIQKRGGWPYYPPSMCKRYGLNVSGKYDGGSDKWLMMDGNPQEWAVAFHGVSSPNTSCRNTKVLNCILEGLQKGEMLIAGGGQAYASSNALNKPSQNVGNGIYCSPHFQVCLSGYSSTVKVQGKDYHLILQCRVNPRKIKVCGNHQYWVINQSKNIRPYGILLVKADMKSQIKPASQLFGNPFRWENSKAEVESFLAKQQ